MNTVQYLIITAILPLAINSASAADLVVKHQETGPYVNCYLLYDPVSREAAIFDPGGPIDSLHAVIAAESLTVKYVFFTQGHIDHVLGLQAVREACPGAKVGIHRDDYDDMQVQVQWILENLTPEEIAEWKSDSAVEKMFHYDAGKFGKVDLWLEEGQVYKFGDNQIKTLHTSGHSRGSICFAAGDLLFTGDLLMRKDVGRSDFQNSSPEDLIRSVRRLYKEFPDSTVVYPGHGPATTIGSEKRDNPKISTEKSNL